MREEENTAHPSARKHAPTAYLRPLAASDAHAVLMAFQSADDMNRQGDVHDLASAQLYVERLISLDSGHRPWAIAREDDTLAGLVVVSIDQKNSIGWFWYWLNSADRGHGWASSAALAVADWALSAGGLHRLELGHRANNPASGSVARAAGFVHEGCERKKFLVDGQWIDVLTYGRLASDPIPAGPRLPMREHHLSEGPGIRC